MGLFRRKPEPEQRVASMSAAELILLADGGRRHGSSGTAGQVVNNETAMQMMAMWRCRHLIADVVSGLPIDQFKQVGKRRVEVPKSEFVADPSTNVEPEEWVYQLVMSAVSTGNALGFVTEFDTAGFPRKSEVLDWGDVDVSQRGALAPPVYKVNHQIVDIDRVLHMRAFGPRPGSVLGMNPVEYARQTIGLGLAVRNFGASWYESGGHPTTLLSTEQNIDEVQAIAAKDQFRNATLVDHLAVLGNGWDLKSVQVAPSDALFLAASNASAVDICGYHGIPPEMLGYAAGGSSVTYANREQRALDVLVWTLQWWIGRVEKLISRQLPPDQFVKINVDALLRSDALTRWTVHDKAVRLGARTNDEVRDLEDQQAIPGGLGEQFLWPPAGATTAPEDDEARRIAELIQKIYLGVGVVINEEEAREILNRGGAGLTGAMNEGGA